tara:strand:+ start:5577 stop:6161 length:585 start_codon:yes stop_codon:yes gene_type:complete
MNQEKALKSKKNLLRRHFRQIRNSCDIYHDAIVDRIKREIVAPISASSKLGFIGLYWPLKGEIDLRVLRQQFQVALPVADGHGTMTYRAWNEVSLSPDACKIPAPSEGASLNPTDLSVLLVPGLAIDEVGIRLGYGGGYYDRLRAHQAWKSVPAYVVLPSDCLSLDPLPRDSWDIPFNGSISEIGLRLSQAQTA